MLLLYHLIGSVISNDTNPRTYEQLELQDDKTCTFKYTLTKPLPTTP